MKKNQNIKNSSKIYIFVKLYILYFLLFFLYYSTIIRNGLLIKFNEISLSNLIYRMIQDFLGTFPLLIIITFFYTEYTIYLKVSKRNLFLILLLGFVYILLFFLHNDYTIKGLYRFFYYLIIVAFTEEVMYRGILYYVMKQHSVKIAIIVSGMFFGIMHAVIPSILSNNNIINIILLFMSELGGGIVIGSFFIFVLEKSKTLWIGILIHAILDYSIGLIGTLTAILCFLYLYFNSRNDTKIKKNFVT